MNQAAFNIFCASLAHTHHVIQWGGADVWKVGTADKNKVFAVGGLRTNDDENPFGISFKCSEIGFEVLRDTPGCRPAPYMASRGMKWIQWFSSEGVSSAELKEHLANSHRLSSLNLTKRLQKTLGLNQGAVQ